MNYYETAASDRNVDGFREGSSGGNDSSFTTDVELNQSSPFSNEPTMLMDTRRAPIQALNDTRVGNTIPPPTNHTDHRPFDVRSNVSPNVSFPTTANVTTTSADIDNNFFYNITRPTNLRLVIMGDSISRYQYISLVHFLQTGTWITDDTKLVTDVNEQQSSELPSNTPLHCKTPGIKAREQFYSLSHSFLQPNELLCDCRAYSENRYYIDTERNNYIAYITKFGKNSTSGRYFAKHIAADLRKGNGYDKQQHRQQLNKRKPDQWNYKYWNETIHYHIAQLKPKPQFLLFNAGLHPHDLHFKYIRQSILDVTQRHNIIPIYKTTTYPNNVSIGLNDFHLSRHDSLLCGNKSTSSDGSAAFDYCIDMSWTSQLFGNNHYYDYYHFKPYWNYYMNVQTLLYIQNIQMNMNLQDLKATQPQHSKFNNVPAIFGMKDVERTIGHNVNKKNI
jgi:hypothetical protein